MRVVQPGSACEGRCWVVDASQGVEAQTLRETCISALENDWSSSGAQQDRLPAPIQPG